MLYDEQQLYENLLVHDHDDRRKCKQYKYMLHIVHNNNERIQFDDAKHEEKQSKENFRDLFESYFAKNVLFDF